MVSYIKYQESKERFLKRLKTSKYVKGENMNKFEIEYEFEIRRYKGDYYDPTEYVDTLEYTYTLDEEDLKEWLDERDIEYSDLEEAFEDNYEALKEYYRKVAKESAKFWL